MATTNADKRLLWGKPKSFEVATLTGGTAGTYRALELPKNGSLTLSSEAGETVEALEEGGDVVDSYTKSNKYTVEWDEFVKNGVDPAFEDVNGIVDGEFSLRWTGRNKTVPGLLVKRCTVHVTPSFTTADGYLRHHKATVLAPTDGSAMLATYTPTTGA